MIIIIHIAKYLLYMFTYVIHHIHMGGQKYLDKDVETNNDTLDGSDKSS